MEEWIILASQRTSTHSLCELLSTSSITGRTELHSYLYWGVWSQLVLVRVCVLAGGRVCVGMGVHLHIISKEKICQIKTAAKTCCSRSLQAGPGASTHKFKFGLLSEQNVVRRLTQGVQKSESDNKNNLSEFCAGEHNGSA